jgi:large subunit ribosomal protein L21
MYAVISTGGKQYRVAPGDRVRVETIAAEVGSVVEFNNPVLVSNQSGELLFGQALNNAIGHRQNYTELTVGEVIV